MWLKIWNELNSYRWLFFMNSRDLSVDKAFTLRIQNENTTEWNESESLNHFNYSWWRLYVSIIHPVGQSGRVLPSRLCSLPSEHHCQTDYFEITLLIKRCAGNVNHSNVCLELNIEEAKYCKLKLPHTSHEYRAYTERHTNIHHLIITDKHR